ncbi:MAG: nucleotidyltransferase family protein, partial [Pseudomonadota bacterium]
MRALILSAGRGARMRPWTDRMPKPLIPLAGKPLIVHQIERLQRAGYTELVINLGWLGEQIESVLGSGQPWGVSIQYSREPDGALETAGGMAFARPLLGEAPYLVINSDIWMDFPLDTLMDHEPDGDAHLVFVHNPPHHEAGDFAIQNGRATLMGAPKYTYSGLGVYRPGLVDHIPAGPWPLRPVLDQAIGE